MQMKRGSTLALILCAICQLAWADTVRPIVKTVRVPNGGIQPQLIVGKDGAIHMLYYKGEAGAGDIFYVKSDDSGQSFSEPQRVNSQLGSAIAAGTIRGAHLALGKHDRVHVAWNGSGKATPKGLPNPQIAEDSPYRLSSPMLYARMNADGTGFEPQRNLMTSTYALDGGGSVAADDEGNVYVVWHANSVEGSPGEGERAVWVAISRDDGQTFSAESRANRNPTGACGCCGLRATTDQRGTLFVLYRSADRTVHRDMYLLTSDDRGATFTNTKLDNWEIGQCVMSSAAFHSSDRGLLAAWETEEQVKFARVDGLRELTVPNIVAPKRRQQNRKHPVLSVNSRGNAILAWTEGTGWQRGGSVAWQVFDREGKPMDRGAGNVDGVPVWSNVAVFPGPGDDFTVVY